MSSAQLNDMTVADVMERWPAAVRVFNRRRMACPGCVMAPFMTVGDAAGSYELQPSELGDDLLAAVSPDAADTNREAMR